MDAKINIKSFGECTCTEDLKVFCPVGNVPLDSRFSCNEQWCSQAYDNYVKHVTQGRSKFEDSRSILLQLLAGTEVSGEMKKYAYEAAVEALDMAIISSKATESGAV